MKCETSPERKKKHNLNQLLTCIASGACMKYMMAKVVHAYSSSKDLWSSTTPYKDVYCRN